MSADKPDDLTEEEKLYFTALDAAAMLAEQCKELRDRDAPAGRSFLDEVMNCLMTELWDRSFSQSEIRAAYNAALDDMNRYAAGQERR